MQRPASGLRLTRRNFLVATAQLTCAALLSTSSIGLAATAKQHPLSFYHTHTGERLRLDFHPATCTTKTIQKINTFFRDHRTGAVFPIDLRLLEMLCRIQQISGSTGTFEVISGYRSPITNQQLRKKSSGVAQKSLHLEGQALDIRLTDLRTKKLRDIAQSLHAGGVGYYAKSNFVHLDTGRVRFW